MAEPGDDDAPQVPDLELEKDSLLDRTVSQDVVDLPEVGEVPRRVLMQYCADRKRDRIVRNLASFLAVELQNQTQERPYYAIISYLLTHFLDTIDLGGDTRGSILCCPQPRFRDHIFQPSDVEHDASPTAASKDISSSHAASAALPTNVANPAGNNIPNAQPEANLKKPKEQQQASTRQYTYRDPDFSECVYFEGVEGVREARSSMESWVEVKPKVKLRGERWEGVPEEAVEAEVQMRYEMALIADMNQLREQAELAFAADDSKESFTVTYTRGLRFTAFKWDRSTFALATSTADNKPLLAPVNTEPEVSASDSSAHASGNKMPPYSLTDSPSPHSAVEPVPVDPETFKGVFNWGDELRTVLLAAAEAARDELWPTLVNAHKGKISEDSLAILRTNYDTEMPPEFLVDTHPQPLYHYAEIIEGEGREMRAADYFTNTLRLAHAGMNPTGAITFELSTFFSVLDDEYLYQPSDIELDEIMEFAKEMYSSTLKKEWAPRLERNRRPSEPREVGNTSNTTYQETEGRHSSDSSFSDNYLEEAVLERNELELARRPSDLPPFSASFEPSSAARNESHSISASTGRHIADRVVAQDSTLPDADTSSRVTRAKRKNTTTSQLPGSGPSAAPNSSLIPDEPPSPDARPRRGNTGQQASGQEQTGASIVQTRARAARGRAMAKQQANGPGAVTRSKAAATALASASGMSGIVTASRTAATNAHTSGANAGPSTAGPSRLRHPGYASGTQASRAKAKSNTPREPGKKDRDGGKGKGSQKAEDSGAAGRTVDRKGKKRMRDEVGDTPKADKAPEKKKRKK